MHLHPPIGGPSTSSVNLRIIAIACPRGGYRVSTPILALGKSLGLDPASAARLDAITWPAGEERDELAEFAAKRGRPTGEPPATFKPGATILDYVRGPAAS